MEQNYSYEDLMNIGKGANQSVYYDKDGNEAGRGKANSYSYYHQDRCTYSIMTKREYMRNFKTISLVDALDGKFEDIGRMEKLRENIKGDNMIMYSTGSKKISVPATKENIYSMIGLAQKRGKEFIDRMINKRIISEWTETITGNKRYYLNPLYGMIGTEVTLDVYALFKEELDPFLEPRAKEDLAKLLWVRDHSNEYEAMEREYDAKKEVERQYIIEQDSIFVNNADEHLEEIMSNSEKEIFSDDTIELGYMLVKDSIAAVKEIYGLKAKLHFNKETATIEKINACKNALDYYFNKAQNSAVLTLLSKGLITLESK